MCKELSLKRIFDITFSDLGLILSAPVWLAISILIWLESGPPIFYSQERVGKDGRIFKGLKFRSMIKTAEEGLGPVQAKEQDKRVTCVGRILRATAMDELPQLWNIFTGDMSFVGPRALRPFEIDNHDGLPRSVWEIEGFKERSRVVPGLTGIAQVLAPRDIPRKVKFQHDIWYVKHQSFWLDLRVIILSFLVTFMGKWESRQGRFGAFEKWVKVSPDLV